ncbi:MAG: hypothetical protein WD767_06385 [Alphaproteobacteria bacterium]
MENTLTLWSIAQLGVVSTAVTLGVGWIRDHIKQRQTTERDATYLANRIAPVLERYALECAELISAQALDEDFESYGGSRRGTIPPFPNYPSDVDWRSVDKKIGGRLLMFPNEVIEAAGHYYFIHNLHDDICVGSYDLQVGRVGYRAWVLACELRNEFKLPKPFTSWPYLEDLKEKHDEAVNTVELGGFAPSMPLAS